MNRCNIQTRFLVITTFIWTGYLLVAHFQFFYSSLPSWQRQGSGTAQADAKNATEAKRED
jgi:hypothetical protein